MIILWIIAVLVILALIPVVVLAVELNNAKAEAEGADE